MKRIFLNEKITLSVIILNASVIFLSESRIESPTLIAILANIDLLCIIYFLIEMVVKHSVLGLRGYWKDAWNKIDGIIVLISLPSLLTYFLPIDLSDLSVLLSLRLLRVMRFFRIVRFFPGFTKLVKGFKMALTQCGTVLLSYAVIVVIFGLINCSLFSTLAPEEFGTPLSSIYSVFRLFTVEGWYELPDKVAAATTPFLGSLVTFYFCLQLIVGGIIGMSFINSIFVDAMVSDNNDEVLERIDALSKQIEELKAIVKKES